MYLEETALDRFGRMRLLKTPDDKSFPNRNNRLAQARGHIKAVDYSGRGFNFAVQDRYVIEGAIDFRKGQDESTGR